MLMLVVGAFLVLHGLVHLLYFGQSWRLFELQSGLSWPDNSWALSGLVGDEATRVLASVACALAALGFVVGGAGVLFRQPWWRPVVVGSAALSAAIFILLWDGGVQRLDAKGGVGLLIGVAMLAAVLAARWPEFEF